MQNADTTARKLTTSEREAISRTRPASETDPNDTGRIRLVSTYGKLYDDIIDDGMLGRFSHEALKVYLVLVRFANRAGVSWPGMGTIGKLGKMRKASVRGAVDELVDLGVVEIVSAGHRQRTVYQVVDRQMRTGSQRRRTEDPTGSRENGRRRPENATDDPQTGDHPADRPKTSGTRTRGSLREPQQTRSVCCDARAQRHTEHAMQISRNKDRIWDRRSVFGIMVELCQTHRDEEIKWVIEHTGPDAKTPGLIRDLTLKKPTAIEIEERRRLQAQRAAEKRRYYSQKATPEQLGRFRASIRSWLDRQGK